METSVIVDFPSDEEFYSTLSQCTSQNVELMKQAEYKIGLWETIPRFYTACSKVLSMREAGVCEKQMAAMILKNGAEKYWRKLTAFQTKEHIPVISEIDKAEIRLNLMNSLEQESLVVVDQLAVVIAKIARVDCPKDWPELIPSLMDHMKNPEDKIQHEVSLAVLCEVVKTLSQKRLSRDRKIFLELTSSIYPFFIEYLNFTSYAIMNSTKDYEVEFNIRKLRKCIKILAKLRVYGFTSCQSREELNFLVSIFDRVKSLLVFRFEKKAILTENSSTMLEKIIVTMLKILLLILELHPAEYIDLVEITFLNWYYYAFQKEGNDLIFKKALIKWFNLTVFILSSHELCRYSCTVKDELTKLDIIKQTFFTADRCREICNKLMDNYFLLTPKELQKWDSDSESYVAEEFGESWRYKLRPCVQTFYCAFMKSNSAHVIPMILDMKKQYEILPDTNDMAGILRMDALLQLMGLSIYDFFNELNFEQWFRESLVTVLRTKTSNYRVLRRRTVWLVGEWSGVHTSHEMRPLLYAELLDVLRPEEDMAVKITVATAIKMMLDDFDFRSEDFLEFIPTCFQALFALLLSSEMCETKMQILNVLSFIIERVGWLITPYFGSLVGYLPLLWEHSAEHNMLRCAIVSVLTHIIKGLGNQCITLEEFIVPVIEYSLDLNQDGNVYLSEDGLYLYSAYLENIKQASENVFRLFNYVHPYFERSTENLKLILNVAKSLLLLSPNIFIQMYGQTVVSILLSLVPDLKALGIEIVLKFFESLLNLAPSAAIELLQNFFVENINCIIKESPENIIGVCVINDSLENINVVKCRLPIIARVILLSKNLFSQVIENYSLKYGLSPEQGFSKLLEAWLSSVQDVWVVEKRKLLALALLNLFTAGSATLLSKFGKIMVFIVETLHDVMTFEDNDQVEVDSLLMPDEPEEKEENDENSEYKTENDIRKAKAARMDPVYTVDLLAYLKSQLAELQQQLGEVSFEVLMKTIPDESLDQLKVFLAKPTSS